MHAGSSGSTVESRAADDIIIIRMTNDGDLNTALGSHSRILSPHKQSHHIEQARRSHRQAARQRGRARALLPSISFQVSLLLRRFRGGGIALTR